MSTESTSLIGRVALVTGGSRGIGRAIALELARAGASVVITYRSDTGGAEQSIKQIEEAGGRVSAVRCDVADLSAIEGLVKQMIEEYLAALAK